MVLKRLIDTTVTLDPLHIPDSFANSKSPRNKRKNKETKEPSKPLYHVPNQVPKESKWPRNNDKEKDPDFEPKTKRQKKEKDKSEEKQYHPPKQVPNNLELHMEETANADVESVR